MVDIRKQKETVVTVVLGCCCVDSWSFGLDTILALKKSDERNERTTACMSYSSKLFCNFVVSVLALKRGLHASICFYARFSVNRPPSFQSKEATEGWPSVRCSQRKWNIQHLYNLHLNKSSIYILHHLTHGHLESPVGFLYCRSLERCINVACEYWFTNILLFFVCSMFNTHTHIRSTRTFPWFQVNPGEICFNFNLIPS